MLGPVWAGTLNCIGNYSWAAGKVLQAVSYPSAVLDKYPTDTLLKLIYILQTTTKIIVYCVLGFAGPQVSFMELSGQTYFLYNN